MSLRPLSYCDDKGSSEQRTLIVFSLLKILNYTDLKLRPQVCFQIIFGLIINDSMG